MKYEYENLFEQIEMLLNSKGKVEIHDLRVFYPRASWTELRHALKNAHNVIYDEKTHAITLGGE